MGNVAGQFHPGAPEKAFLKGTEEQPQKSSACKFGSPKNSLCNTSSFRSSSRYSCTRNSCRFGVRSRHWASVSDVRLRALARSLAVEKRAAGLKCEKSSLRT